MLLHATLKNVFKLKTGRPHIFNNHDEIYVCRLVTTGKYSTATTIQTELRENAAMKVYTNTMVRTLCRNNIRYSYKNKKVQLPKSPRRDRRMFEKSHTSYTDSGWDRVIWSDECKINLCGLD